MELVLKRIYPSKHVWEGGDAKWHRYTVALSVYKRFDYAYEMRIETSGCQGQKELQRFRAKSIEEFVPLAIKECLISLETFRDFVYRADDLDKGLDPGRYNDLHAERPYITEEAHSDFCYEVLGEDDSWALGINADGSADDIRNGGVYTATEIASMQEFYRKETAKGIREDAENSIRRITGN